MSWSSVIACPCGCGGEAQYDESFVSARTREVSAIVYRCPKCEEDRFDGCHAEGGACRFTDYGDGPEPGFDPRGWVS